MYPANSFNPWGYPGHGQQQRVVAPAPTVEEQRNSWIHSLQMELNTLREQERSEAGEYCASFEAQQQRLESTRARIRAVEASINNFFANTGSNNASLGHREYGHLGNEVARLAEAVNQQNAVISGLVQQMLALQQALNERRGQ